MQSFFKRAFVGALLIILPGLLPVSAHAATTSSARADFNGDGKSDLLWINYATHQLRVWFMNGATKLGEASLGTVPPKMWLAAVASFNGDGQPDLYWHDGATGNYVVWQMHGTQHVGTVTLPKPDSSKWVLSGAADFNGDGQTDLVWRRYDTGENTVWLMHGATITKTVPLPKVPYATWAIEAVTDLNGDGHPDITWGNPWAGINGAYLMNGTNVVVNTSHVPADTDPNWRITGNPYVGPGNRAGIVMRNYGTGANKVVVYDWQPDPNKPKIDPSLSFALPSLPDPNWQLVDPIGFASNEIMTSRESQILQMEGVQLYGGGFNAYAPSGVSSLFTIWGGYELSYPARASTSVMFQYRKRDLENNVEAARVQMEAAVIQAGGYTATDPQTGRPALFQASGGKVFVFSDNTWR